MTVTIAQVDFVYVLIMAVLTVIAVRRSEYMLAILLVLMLVFTQLLPYPL